MEQETLNINIKIGEKNLPMKIRKSEEERYRNAAKIAMEKYKMYQKTYDSLPVEDIMAMVILDLAKSNIDLSEKKENSSFFLELSDIVDTLGGYIKAQ